MTPIDPSILVCYAVLIAAVFFFTGRKVGRGKTVALVAEPAIEFDPQYERLVMAADRQTEATIRLFAAIHTLATTRVAALERSVESSLSAMANATSDTFARFDQKFQQSAETDSQLADGIVACETEHGNLVDRVVALETPATVAELPDDAIADIAAARSVAQQTTGAGKTGKKKQAVTTKARR